MIAPMPPGVFGVASGIQKCRSKDVKTVAPMELPAKANQPRLRYVAHVVGNGTEFLRAADDLG